MFESAFANYYKLSNLKQMEYILDGTSAYLEMIMNILQTEMNGTELASQSKKLTEFLVKLKASADATRTGITEQSTVATEEVQRWVASMRPPTTQSPPSSPTKKES